MTLSWLQCLFEGPYGCRQHFTVVKYLQDHTHVLQRWRFYGQIFLKRFICGTFDPSFNIVFVEMAQRDSSTLKLFNEYHIVTYTYWNGAVHWLELNFYEWELITFRYHERTPKWNVLTFKGAIFDKILCKMRYQEGFFCKYLSWDFFHKKRGVFTVWYIYIR